MEVSTAAQVFYKSFKTLFILSSIIISIHGTWCLYDVHTCAYPPPPQDKPSCSDFMGAILYSSDHRCRPDSPKA